MGILQNDGAHGPVVSVRVRELLELCAQDSETLTSWYDFTSLLAVCELPPHREIPITQCVFGEDNQRTDSSVVRRRKRRISEMPEILWKLPPPGESQDRR